MQRGLGSGVGGPGCGVGGPGCRGGGSGCSLQPLLLRAQYGGSGENTASALEDPLDVLKRGYAVALSLSTLGVILASWCFLYTDTHPDAWWKFACCGLVGLLNAVIFLQLAQYYTDYAFTPVRRIAAASTTGHGTNIIAGVAVGLESTCGAAVAIGASILAAYHIGSSALPGGGLFGTSVATMGMLSSAVYVLAMDTFGPIADNAGGIVEMSDQPEMVRDITDRLDAVGNVTKVSWWSSCATYTPSLARATCPEQLTTSVEGGRRTPSLEPCYIHQGGDQRLLDRLGGPRVLPALQRLHGRRARGSNHMRSTPHALDERP